MENSTQIRPLLIQRVRPSHLLRRLNRQIFGSKRLYIGWFGGVQVVSKGEES